MHELGHQPARLFERLGTIRAARREMRGNRRALLLVERTEGVRLDQLPNLVVFAHRAACSPSFKRNNPFLIQLFTVPNGSFNVCAISLWLNPSK